MERAERKQPGLGARALRALRLLHPFGELELRRALMLAGLCIVIGASAAAAAPLALRRLIDGLAAGAGATRTPWGIWLAGYIAALVALRIASEGRAYWSGRAEQRAGSVLAAAAFDHALRLPMCVHLKRSAHVLSGVIEQGVRAAQALLAQFASTLAPVALELALSCGVLLALEQQKYLAVLLGGAAAYVLVFARGAADVATPARDIARAHVAARGFASERLLAVETVKAFTAETRSAGAYARALATCDQAWRRFYGRRASNGVWVALVSGGCIGVSVWLAALDVQRGASSVGELVMISAYVLRLTAPMEALGLAVRDVVRSLALLPDLLGVLEQSPESSGEESPSGSAREAALSFEQVTFAYADGVIVLRDITFTAAAGSTLAIVGASGAGKSSLVRLLLGLQRPTRGRIRINGVAVERWSLRTLRRRVAVVMQDAPLFEDSIAQNIAFGEPAADAAHIERAAQIAGLDEGVARMPAGYEEGVGNGGARLSGGERQRVAIARALLRDAQVMVLDEATAALDSVSERGVLQALRRAMRGRTLVVISHRLAAVQDADEILVVHEGMIVERGGHDDLLARGGCYARLWAAQGADGNKACSLCGPAK